MDIKKDYSQFLIKLVADSIAIIGSWFLAYFLRFYIIPGGVGEPFHIFAPMSLLVWVLYLFFLNYNKLYRVSPSLTWQAEIQMLFYSGVAVFLTLTVILYYFYGSRVSRLTIAIFMAVSTLVLIIERLLLNRRLTALRSSGKIAKRVLVIGFGDGVNKYIQEMAAHPEYGMKVVGQYDTHNNGNKQYVQFDGKLDDVIATTKPDIVVIGYPSEASELEKKMIGQCYDLIQRVLIIPDLPYSMIGTRIAIGIVSGRYNSPNVDFLVMTKAIGEMRRMLKLYDCDQETIFNYCGIGDLGLTALNDLSRNRTLGLLIGKGFSNNPKSTTVIEGLRTIKLLGELVRKKKLEEEFVVLESLYSLIYTGTSLNDYYLTVLA
jgi:hypothetical protein